MKLTLAHKRAIREHIRSNGLDPHDMSPTAFMEYAREHNLLDADKIPTTTANTPARKAPKPTATTDEDVDRKAAQTEAHAPQPRDMPNPANYDLNTAEGAQQYAQDLKEAQEHNRAIEAAQEHLKPLQDALEQAAEQLEAMAQQVKDAEKNADKPKTLVIEKPDHEPVTIDKPHNLLERVLRLLNNGLNVYMNGPAGSGKTTLAMQAAKALDATFYFTGKLAEEYQLLGYNNANGDYVPTEFYKACTSDKPAVFLFDEFDDSESKAVTKFNAALANRFMDFPCGRVEIPDHVHFIAAGNTTGKGGNRTYLRNQLDGATMDRFVFLTVDYDLDLERELALSRNADAGPWVDWVQSVRVKAERAGLNMVVSPRATIHGAVMLAAGFTMEDCKHMTVYKGASEDQIAALS